VALTASAFEHDRDAIIEAGCDDFVPKPYRESTIFQRLSAHLGIRFRLEDAPSASPRAPTSASIEIPREFVEELRTAVTAGDVVEAVGIVERIAHVDAAAAAELRRLLRSYRFEELQVRLDRAEQEAADT
jgi:DNA-binding response OmpR family regulator